MDTEIWITYSVDMTGNVIFLSFFFFQFFKKQKLFLAGGPYKIGNGPNLAPEP